MSYMSYRDYPIEHLPVDIIVYRDGEKAVAVDRKGNRIAGPSSDHQTVLDAALDFVRKKDGGAIFLGPGTYKANIMIDFSRISIFGSGVQPTRLEPADTSRPVLSIVRPKTASEDLYGITIQNLFIAGNGLPDTVDIVYMERVFDVRMINVYVDGGSEKAGRSALRMFQAHEVDIVGCVFERTSGDGVVVISGDLSYHNRIIGGQILNGKNTNLVIRNYARHNRIIGTSILSAGEHGVLVADNAEYNKLLGVVVGRAGMNTWGVGVALSSNNNELANATVYDDQDTPTMRYAVYETGENNYVHSVKFPGNYVAGCIYTEGKSIIRRYMCMGKPSEKTGIATVTGDGTTTTFTVDVEHGLASDKVAAKVALDRPGSYKVYLVDTDDDGFKETLRIVVTYDTAPSSGETAYIYWEAEVVA